MSDNTPSRLSPGLKLLVEWGPLLVYFLITFKVHERLGLDLGQPVFRPAIIWLIISTPFQVAILWWAERKVPWAALITAIFLIGFGLVSLYMDDDRWIKAKPSVVYFFFAAALLFGLVFRRPLLKFYLASQIDATDAQWNRLTLNFAWFFLAMTAANVAVWLGFDALHGAGTDQSFQGWSASKPVFMVVSSAFTIWQLWPFIKDSVQVAETEAKTPAEAPAEPKGRDD